MCDARLGILQGTVALGPSLASVVQIDFIVSKKKHKIEQSQLTRHGTGSNFVTQES